MIKSMSNYSVKKTIRFDCIDSTNDYLLENYQVLDNSTLVIAEKQSKGKGRKGHNWVSNGDNIYMSLLIKDMIINSPNLLTLITGLALSRTIDKLYKVNTLIKWPNDIFLNNLKVAGILVETKYSNKLECIVIGVGINVNQLDFNNDELVNATSLLKETNIKIDKELIISTFIENYYDLFNMYLTNGFTNFVDEINNKLYILNKEIFVTNNPEINGLCVGISSTGELLIKTNSEVISLNSKEVSIRVK